MRELFFLRRESIIFTRERRILAGPRGNVDARLGVDKVLLLLFPLLVVSLSGPSGC